MVLINLHLNVPIPAEVAFDYVTDFARMPEWLFGLQSARCVSELEAGVGARYEIAVKLGAMLRTEIEVTECVPHRLLTAQSLSGIANQSNWRLTELGDELTEIDISMSYELPRGLAGRALAKAIDPFIAVAKSKSEGSLRTALETEHQKRVPD